jgi:ArsR family transcriptional regulator, arsenate/arsenite/antimonite-responsive transcriptional repressor
MVQSKTELFDKELAEMAVIFKALAHPARLRILQFLAETQTCITGDISDELPLGRTTVNQHLKELKDTGLIQGHIDGVKTKYCLEPEKLSEVKTLLIGFLEEIEPADDFVCET